MATQMRQPRTRSGGGRTLMLLGVLLALAAGTIVIYVVSQASGSGGRTVTVVVASQTIPTNKILSATTSDDVHLLISSVFTTKQVNADFVPTDVYTYTDMNHLNIALQDEVVVGQFYEGDILRQSDPRLVPAGKAAQGSLTLLNPAALPAGDVLYPLKMENVGQLVSGDHVDLLASYTVSNGAIGGSSSGTAAGGLETQTTFQNLLVYSVTKDGIYVVVSHQDALTLKYLTDSGANMTLVLRAPGDTNPSNTFPATGSYIYQHFHFTQP